MTQKSLNDAVGPTGMSDATATMLGLKTYSHGTTYKDGIAPTITLVAGGGTLSSIQVGDFIPYQTQAGAWRLRFSVSATVSTTARLEVVLRVVGVVTPAYIQTFSGTTNAQAAMTRLRMTANGGDINWEHASATMDNYYGAGDIALAAKPTWAY